jgi:hypothetical protein
LSIDFEEIDRCGVDAAAFASTNLQQVVVAEADVKTRSVDEGARKEAALEDMSSFDVLVCGRIAIFLALRSA